MSWTNPGTVTAGEVFTASFANANILRNLETGHPIVTTAQRDVLSGVSTGMEVYNTTTGSFQIYNGTSWQISRPFAIEAARGSYATNSTINLTSGRFTQAPLVTTGMNSRGAALVYVITSQPGTASFAVEYSSAGTYNLSWMCVQMLAGGASG